LDTAAGEYAINRSAERTRMPEQPDWITVSESPAPDGCGFVIVGVGGERDEVLAARLHGVCGGFAGLAVVQERGKPVRKLIGPRCVGRLAAVYRRTSAIVVVGQPFTLSTNQQTMDN